MIFRRVYLVLSIVTLGIGVRAQTLICEKTYGYGPGVERMGTVAEMGGGNYLVSISSDSLSTVLQGPFTKRLYSMAMVKIDPNCDTLWTKTFDSIGFGRSFIKKVGNNKLLVAGGLENPSTYFTIPSTHNPFAMQIDSNGTVYWHQVYFGEGAVNHVLPLADGGYILTGVRYPNAISGNGRVFIIRTDSVGTTIWDKAPADLPGVVAQNPGDIIQTNDGCFLITARETNASNITRPRLIKFNLDGDTVWTKRMELPNVNGSNNVSFTKASLYKQAVFFSSGAFNDPTISNFPRSLIIEVDSIWNEMYRISEIGSANDFYFLSGRKSTHYSVNSFSPPAFKAMIRDSLFTIIDSIVFKVGFTFPKIISNSQSELINYGSYNVSGITQGQDFYFAKYSNPHGPRYEHDYCGQNLPTASYFATATQDSLFIHNISLSGLDCIPTLSHLEWNSYSQFFNSNAPGLAFAKAGLPDTLDLELIATNYFGCRDTIQWSIAVQTGDLVASVKEATGEPVKINIYPNPARDRVTVRYEGHSPYWSFDRQAVVYPELTLYDIHGRTVHTALLKEPTTEMDISGLPAGMYFYRAVIGERMKTGKLTVE